MDSIESRADTIQVERERGEEVLTQSAVGPSTRYLRNED
jgi:hypothetical protein